MSISTLSSNRVITDDVYIDKLREVVSSNIGGRSQEPAQLLPHVWLGSQRTAESYRILRNIGVTHVLNCAGYKGPRENPDANPYEGLDIDYKEFKADDEDCYDITQHFREAFNYLDRVQKLGGVCLVHCALGINRSGAISTAYLMMHNNWALVKTVTFIKQRRRVVLSNAGFRRQLVRFARLKGLLDQLPEEEYEDDVKKYTRRLTFGSYGTDDRSRGSYALPDDRTRGSYTDDLSRGVYADDRSRGSYTNDILCERPSRSIDRDLYRGPRSSSLTSYSSYRSRDSAPPRTEYQRGDATLDFLYNRFINREKF